MTQDERTLALAVNGVCSLNKLVNRLASVAQEQCASVTDDDVIALCEMTFLKRRFLTLEMRLLARNLETKLRGGRGT